MIDYLDKTLDERLRQEVENHLETCERCLDELKDCQQLLNLISKDEMVKPDDSLRTNFYHMLNGEIKKNRGRKEESFQISDGHWYNRIQYRIAAGIALLICGTFIGFFINSGRKNSYAANELSQLKSEVTALKKTAMFTMLNDESSSDRLQAVGYADEIDSPDQNVIDILIKTLNTDKNVNVRMAAAYALSKYSGQRQVCDSLVKSLSLQNEPILQITLINILAERKEKSAFKAFQQLIENKNTMKEVRAAAQNGMKMMI